MSVNILKKVLNRVQNNNKDNIYFREKAEPAPSVNPNSIWSNDWLSKMN